MTEPRTFTITSPGIPPTLNDRLHPLKRYSICRKHVDYVAWECKALGVRPPLDRFKVTATLFRTNGGPKDPDGAVQAIKANLDGLVRGGLVVDDSPAHLVELVVRQERGGSRCVRLVVEEVIG